MQNLNKKIIILIAILIIGNLFFASMYVSAQIKNKKAEQILTNQQTNEKVLAFSQLFFDKVLQGTQTVSFDDRLQLENAVRALNDKTIFDAWTKFTNAKSQADIQSNFYSLFKLLLKKITP